MTQKELIRQEIERRAKFHDDAMKACVGLNNIAFTHSAGWEEDSELLAFIDSLPEEKPSEDLEEAAEMAARKIYPYEGGMKGLICENSIPIYKAGFIAGAEWMRKHSPLPEDTVLFHNGVEEGKRLIMEDAAHRK